MNRIHRTVRVAASRTKRTARRAVLAVPVGTRRSLALHAGVMALRLHRGRVPSLRLLQLLDFGWSNPGWRASPEYLTEVARQAIATSGTVVEAGSGLSTVVLTHVVRRDQQVVSLEHLPEWAERVRRLVPRSRRRHVLARPLVDRGEYDWYDTSPADFPAGVTLVIVDGPPGSTRGGRFGALPELLAVLASRAVILVDDAHRSDEQAMIAAWAERWGVRSEMRPRGADAFAIVEFRRSIG